MLSSAGLLLSLVPAVSAFHLNAARPPAMSRATSASMAAPIVPFAKYHGLGNDFVLIDCRDTGKPALSPDEAVKMCDRNFGVGGDGVIFVLPPDDDGAKYGRQVPDAHLQL